MNRSYRLALNKFIKNRSAALSLIILILFILTSLFAPFFAPFSPNEIFSDSMALAPGLGQKFILGTDDVGRDLFSRLIYGARISMGLGIFAVIVAVMVGAPLGLTAGFFGGRWDRIVNRSTDVMLTIPSILIAIVLVAVMGGGLSNTVCAIAVVSLPNIIRVVRAKTLVEKEKLYIQAARSYGLGSAGLIFKHILPNCSAALIVQATLGFSDGILNAAALGFLGLGVEPPTPEWGAMLADSRAFIESAWWLVALPGFCILTASLCFNLVGDGLRDALDPKVQ